MSKEEIYEKKIANLTEELNLYKRNTDIYEKHLITDGYKIFKTIDVLLEVCEICETSEYVRENYSEDVKIQYKKENLKETLEKMLHLKDFPKIIIAKTTDEAHQVVVEMVHINTANLNR